MIIVKVNYTVKQEFAAQNQENILLFLQDFQQMNHPDFRYNVYLGADGKTFTHLSHFKHEAIQQIILNVPSFKYFQQQRDNSGLEVQPQIEVMDLVGSSACIFNWPVF